ncbi:hypothetical protein H7347_02930 [Corynebacterium sp. zg-331]|uniref:Rv1476 family membrane protein n=1 Tax=unclassified Corynebacterium TaxID=2624378 RepID=UPI00128C78BC|nr:MULTISPECIES: DUF6676 family protein [unclassified Corynebacterium]MBC3185538.1 hypothetical protein [Corynebacterium sp. zg-331]MPV52032.1 hypothetical protein [Corynebacterium sp. zg331]
MIPDQIDLAALSAQLNEQGVAIHGRGSDNISWRNDLASAIDAAESTGRGSFGLAVLDFTPAHTPDLRDIAQELHRAAGLDTVIVRAPSSGATVSSVYSRHDIERAQDEFLATANYTTAVREYPEHLADAPIPWIPLSLTALTACLFTLASTYLRSRRES